MLKYKGIIAKCFFIISAFFISNDYSLASNLEKNFDIPLVNMETQIMNEVLGDGVFGDEDAYIINLNSLSRKNTSDKAIQFKISNGDMVEVTTYIPYSISDDGSLVNTFAYIDTMQSGIRPLDMNDTPTPFVDVTVVTQAYYAKYISSTIDRIPYYRAAGLKAWWTSNNSTATVSRMQVEYTTVGNLHEYPSCLSQNYPSVLQYGYEISSYINSYNPVKGTVYEDLSNIMPFNRVLDILNGGVPGYGSGILITLNYKVNGVTRSQWETFTVLPD